MAPSLASQPPELSFYELSFPAEHVLLVTINRESHMNAIPMAGHWQGERLWQWFDDEPQLRVAIVTGKGTRAFCCGADLKEQAQKQHALDKPDAPAFPTGGFMGLTTRVGKKPVIAAVNGFALGGGFEIALNWYVLSCHGRLRGHHPFKVLFFYSLSAATWWLPRRRPRLGCPRQREVSGRRPGASPAP